MSTFAPAEMATAPVPKEGAVIAPVLVSSVPPVTLMPPAPLLAKPLRANQPAPALVKVPVNVVLPEPIPCQPALEVIVRLAPMVIAPDSWSDCVPWKITLPPRVTAFATVMPPVVELSSVPPFKVNVPVPADVAFIRFNVPAVSVVPPVKACPA